jgi:hypothetical protein
VGEVYDDLQSDLLDLDGGVALHLASVYIAVAGWVDPYLGGKDQWVKITAQHAQRSGVKYRFYSTCFYIVCENCP